MAQAAAQAAVNWNQVVAGLPNINGEFEVGIAAGTDAELPHTLKLVVFSSGNTNTHNTDAIKTALYPYLRPDRSQEINRELTTACACAGSVAGFWRYAEGTTNPSSDWLAATDTEQAALDELWGKTTEADRNAFKELINTSTVNQCMTLMVSTKINFWMTNHHTGQSRDSLTGYVRKVCTTLDRVKSVTGCTMVSTAHTVRHWACTVHILGAGMCNIAGVKRAGPSYINGESRLFPTQDALKRIQSFPAGTHKVIIAYEALALVYNNALFKFIPNCCQYLVLNE